MIEDTEFGQGVVFTGGGGVGTEGSCVCATDACGCSRCELQAGTDEFQNTFVGFDRQVGI